MPTMTSFAAGAARAFGFTGKPKKLITETFSSGSTQWTCPTGVAQLASVTAQGGTGSAPQSYQTDTTIFSAYFSDFGSGPTNTGNTWANFQGIGPTAVSALNANSTANGGTYIKYANGTDDLTTYSFSNSGDPYWRPGSATLSYSAGWKTSGPLISGDFGQALAKYWRDIPGFAGAATTAFGITWNGGAANGVPPNPITYNNVTVVPGQQYSITNSSSSPVTITYYK